MIISRFSLHTTQISSALRTPSLVFLTVGILAVLGGCDTADPHSSEGPNRTDEGADVQVADEPIQRLDLQYEPVSLAPGETFSIALSDTRHNQPVTRITHEGTLDGRHALTARFDHLHPNSVAIRCRNAISDRKKKVMEVDGNIVNTKSGAHPVAKTSDDPDSYHYVEEDGAVAVIVDYDEEGKAAAPSFDFPSSDESAKCTHVSFVLNGITDLAPTGVKFGGDVPAPSIRRQKVKK